MNLTSKSRYALKIMMDLAHASEGSLVRRRDIVQRQGVPAKYLDQIMILLRRGSLIASIRGRSGGYALARAAVDITVWEIFSAVEEGIYPVRCLTDHGENECSYTMACIAVDPWHMIFDSVTKSLEHLTLASLCKKSMDESKMCPILGIRECQPGKSSSQVYE